MTNKTRYKLYMVAFSGWTEKARALGVTIRQLIKANNYSGKILRRGVAGAFGFDLRPIKSAKTNRRGCNAPGNSRDRRFARRHPQHFNKV